MTRTEALALVRDTIAEFYGVSALRFTSRGSFTGYGSLEVTTLGDRRSERRVKGPREQERLAHELVRVGGPWLAAMQALDPDILLATGCTGRSGFDIDADGTITNRHGTVRAWMDERSRLRRQEAKRLGALANGSAAADPSHRVPGLDLDSVLVDYMQLLPPLTARPPVD